MLRVAEEDGHNESAEDRYPRNCHVRSLPGSSRPPLVKAGASDVIKE
jgi:hypothetical protein